MKRTKSRKRITQVFPWLLPLRKKQRCLFFYTAMSVDGNRYASHKSAHLLPHLLFETKCPMYNADTGFDMVYQENKVFNLKLAATTVNQLTIQPRETFSFWKIVRYADKDTAYKDGLILVDGKLKTSYGGGLCQISNLLFGMFLHTPLTVVERHGHEVKDFPDLLSDALVGVDATISEGWLDLKVRNDTNITLQIAISFDEENIIGQVFTDIDIGKRFEVTNGKPKYYHQDNKLFEEVDVSQSVILTATEKCIADKQLYKNRCEIGYQLPQSVEIETK